MSEMSAREYIIGMRVLTSIDMYIEMWCMHLYKSRSWDKNVFIQSHYGDLTLKPAITFEVEAMFLIKVSEGAISQCNIVLSDRNNFKSVPLQ